MKTILSLFLFCLIGNSITAQDISGNWKGEANVMGQKLKAVFHIRFDNNKYTVLFDSPDQKAFNLPCEGLVITADSILIPMSIIKGSYHGKWNKADEITGAMAQGANVFPLTLQRIKEGSEEKRSEPKPKPQTPVAPFSYDSEDVEYDNADKSVHYGATFTKPRNLKNFPVAIIISGSGSQDRDFTYSGHKFYAVLADYLTNHGIGVLRVDDRGIGKTTLGPDPGSITSETLSHDVETSFDYLRSRTDVDKTQIGLIGHSEGGIIAPMIAARRNDVSFLVLWGAPAVGGAYTNVQQNIYSLKKAGIDSVSLKAFADLHETILSQFRTTTKAGLDKVTDSIFAVWKSGQPAAVLSALMITDHSIVGQDIHQIYHSLFDIDWMRYFISYNPAKDIAKVKCPVLAVNGTKDTQVDATVNLGLIKAILLKRGNKNVEIYAAPSLNHLLQTANTGDVSEYATIEQTIAPEAMELISNWIKKSLK